MSRSSLFITALTLGAALAVPAFADSATIASVKQQAPQPTTLTGDWGGLRTRLQADGITVRGDYVSESFAVADGGLRSGAAYTQQVRAGLDFDMAQIAGWSGAKLHLTLNDRRGKGLSSDYVGNRLPIQEAYGGQYTRLSELSYEQDLSGGDVNLRLGYFAMGNDLGGVAAGCTFVNAAFCAHPLSMSGDSNWYNYPNARWGGALRVRARRDLLVRTGVFQVNPALGQEGKAFKPFAGDTRGAVLPLEVEYTPGQSPGDHALPGSYKLGLYYDTADATRTPGPDPVDSRVGYYALMSQTVWRATDSRRSLAVIGAVTANPRTAAQITRWYMAGLVQTGTFSGRDQDVLGLGVVHAQLNPRLRDAFIGAGPGAPDAPPAGETVVEASYAVQIQPWLVVKPDVQYVIHPGAFSNRNIDDALALGVQVKAQF